MTFSTPNMGLQEVLSFAKDIGYDGIEVRVESKHKHGIELTDSASERQEIKQRALDTGIELCCLATSIAYLKEGRLEKDIEDTKRYLDLAADIGCPSLRIFGGGTGSQLEFCHDDSSINALADVLSSVAGEAEERGVLLCLETHDWWADAHQLAKVFSRVDHPNLAINWDFIHPFRMFDQSVETSFQALKKWIKHVHVHGGYATGREFGGYEFVPLEDERNQFDHRSALRLLQEIDYDGYLSGEWLNRWNQPHEELPRELKSLKAIEAEVTKI